MHVERENHINNISYLSYYFKDIKGNKSLSDYLHHNISTSPIILCIGTDRCIGDALGPLTGTLLKKSNINLPIYGTLENPIHALNIYNHLSKIKKKHPEAFIIALDASLGMEESIGNIIIKKGPLYPGKGVGKSLPSVGDLSIVGIVESFQCDIESAIHNVRLNFIMSMAETITSIILNSLNF